ncbi:hypothetical protein L208DRAFT_1263482, partial [Tricholoma matsutake]
GTVNQSGSLSHFFAILEKVQLNSDHPDFHTLLAALTQVLEGLILHVWQTICGRSSLESFATLQPSTTKLLERSHSIIWNYATPSRKYKPSDKPTK